MLNVWGDVQRKWQALESIFVGSADIRVQLPEDSKRFDAVNADFVVRAQRAGQAFAAAARLQRAAEAPTREAAAPSVFSFPQFWCHPTLPAGPHEGGVRRHKCGCRMHRGRPAGAPGGHAAAAGAVREGAAGEGRSRVWMLAGGCCSDGQHTIGIPACTNRAAHHRHPCLHQPGSTPSASLPAPTRVQDYLETKRIAFPRFYFVAPADLLDILARGSNPQAVIRCGSVGSGGGRRTANCTDPSTCQHAALSRCRTPAGTFPNVSTMFTHWCVPARLLFLVGGRFGQHEVPAGQSWGEGRPRLPRPRFRQQLGRPNDGQGAKEHVAGRLERRPQPTAAGWLQALAGWGLASCLHRIAP